MDTLGSRIRAARRAKKLTQDDLASVFGIARVNVTQWEGNTTRPDPSKLPKLAEVLGVTVDWLVGGGDSAPSSEPSGPIRIQGEVAAGVWLEIDETADTADAGFEKVESPFPADPRFPVSSQFDLIVRGTSINRIARDGEHLRCIRLADIEADVQENDLVIVRRTRLGGHLIETTAKRVRKAGKVFEFWPDSDDARWQEPIILDPKDAKEDETAEILALVVYVYRPVSR